VPFRLDDAEDARYGHILLNNSVDIRVWQDAAGRYLDEEGHLLRIIGTLNAKVDRRKKMCQHRGRRNLYDVRHRNPRCVAYERILEIRYDYKRCVPTLAQHSLAITTCSVILPCRHDRHK
jgi:hypothetical protein